MNSEEPKIELKKSGNNNNRRRVTLKPAVLRKLSATAENMSIRKNELANRLIAKGLATFEQSAKETVETRSEPDKTSNYRPATLIVKISDSLNRIEHLLRYAVYERGQRPASNSSIVKASAIKEMVDKQQGSFGSFLNGSELLDFLRTELSGSTLKKLAKACNEMRINTIDALAKQTYLDLSQFEKVGVGTCVNLRNALKKRNITLQDDEIFFKYHKVDRPTSKLSSHENLTLNLEIPND